MVASVEPPKQLRPPPQLRRAHRFLATTLLPLQPKRFRLVALLFSWKTWLFLGSAAIAMLWGGLHLIHGF
jgi:hypothetical protein